MTGVSNALPGNALQTPAPSVSFHMAESAGIIVLAAEKKFLVRLPRARGFLFSNGIQKAKKLQDSIFKQER